MTELRMGRSRPAGDGERYGCRNASGLGLARCRRSVGAVIAATVLGGLQLGAVELATPEPSGFEKALAKMASQIIQRQHYTRRRLDDEVSVLLFKKYFETLDNDRRFFLADDIEAFRPYRLKLDDALKDGNLEFAYKVYAKLVQRVSERVEYARGRLQEPFDLTVQESVSLDRGDEPWCENRAQLDELWRLRIKNRVLIYTLMAEAGNKDDLDEATAEPAAPGEPTKVAPATSPEEETTTEGEAPDDQTEEAFLKLTPEERALKSYERHLRFLLENEPVDILELYLGALMHIYDPHSTYFAPSTKQDFDIEMKQSLEGIGALLTTEDGYVKIVSILPGGPAEADGRLGDGDRIIAVGQEGQAAVDVVDMPLRKVVAMIRGAKGSEVSLSVIEAGKSLGSMPSRIALTWGEIKLTDRSAKSEVREIRVPAGPEGALETAPHEASAPARAMVIALPSFYSDFAARKHGDKDFKSAARDVRRLLEEAADSDVAGVVLDLRGNGGGGLDEAVRLAGLFFSSGPVVQVRSAGNRRRVHRDPDPDAVYGGPLVVLVNRFSASASEIVAAALQDHGRAVILGDGSTHGKGTVQTVLDLQGSFQRHPVYHNKETGSLKFTVAKFYRVNGESTQRRGVTPDITFVSFADHMDIGEDTLDHALPWDHIKPVEIVPEYSVEPFLGALRERSEERLKDDPDYAEFREAVAGYAQLKERKTLPLNIEARKAYQDEEEKWLEKIRQQTARGRASETKKVSQTPITVPGRTAEPRGDDTEDVEEKDKQDPADDLVLDEALRVLGDLIWLQHGALVARDPGKAVDDEARPDPAAPETGAVRHAAE